MDDNNEQIIDDQDENSNYSTSCSPTQEHGEIVQRNFWLEGTYKKVTRRIEDGARIVDDLSKVIQERAEIESLYANKLKAWKKKWSENFDKSNEYGSLLTATEAILQEGDLLSDLHLSVYGKLTELSKAVQQWKSQRYPKSLTKYKEFRRSEEAFGKAQAPWLTKHKEVSKCMKAYHSAEHTLKNLKEQEETLKADISKADTTQDQINKLNVKVKKSELEIENWNNRYRNSIRDITTYNPKYLEDMKYEFNNCQMFEKIRREAVKEKLEQFMACVDRRMFLNNYERIYSDVGTPLSNTNTENDLEWYCTTFGPDHLFTPLEFVEYDPAYFETAQANKLGPPSPNPKRSSSFCTTL